MLRRLDHSDPDASSFPEMNIDGDISQLRVPLAKVRPLYPGNGSEKRVENAHKGTKGLDVPRTAAEDLPLFGFQGS